VGWDNVGWLGLILGAYLIGSFPTAYLASRLRTGSDIRELGDRNAGAANVYRNLGPVAGITVGVVDIAKGALAVLLARLVTGGVATQMVAGLAVVAGHNWPFFLQFRGGRGAATGLGVLMAIVPVAAIPMGLGALIILLFSRSAMIALSFAFIAMPLLAWFTGASLAEIGYVVLLPVVVGLSHFASLRRVPQPQEQSGQGPVTHTPERR
jgi:glycerol-3-phosphate acyltransferase PlsY